MNLSLSKFNRIESIRREYNNNSAAISFLSMYMWRNVYGDKIVCNDDMYSLRYESAGDNCWFFPCGSRESKIEFISERLDEGSCVFRYALDEDVAFLNEEFAGRFDIVAAPEDSEYLYDVNEHRDVVGHALSDCRRRNRNLEKNYDVHVERLTDQNCDLAKHLFEEYGGSRSGDGILNTNGSEIDLDFLSRAEELGVEGVIVYLDGRPAGVSAGFYLSDSVFNMFLGISDGLIGGLSYYTKQQLIKRLGSEAKIFNLEEDLGIDGLRRMKQELHPIGMNDMWVCTQRR